MTNISNSFVPRSFKKFNEISFTTHETSVSFFLFQVRDEYSFVLTLTDGHLGDGNFITQSFLLLVEDVNDNEPIFKPYPSAITVKEDASPGILTTVEATDLDEGAYGQVYNFSFFWFWFTIGRI